MPSLSLIAAATDLSAGSTPANVVVATHYYATGPAFELEEYLRARTHRMLFIAHPLYTGGGPSYLRRYQDGRVVETLEERAPGRWSRFLADLTRTVRWVRRFGKSELFIAGDNLLALAGLWLRRTGRVRSVVLYSIDYVPQRFANPLLNWLYHRIDRFAASHVDLVWNLSAAIGTARRSRDGSMKTAPAIVVPVGNHSSRIERSAIPSAPHRIAFLGHLLEKQGMQLLLQALPAIRQTVPDVTVLILGEGPYRPQLRDLAARLGVNEIVEFAGFVADHAEIERRLAGSAIAVAPYVPEPQSFTRFADPGKIKTYLGCGLPVVLTDVSPGARVIEERGAGRIIGYDAGELASAVVAYLEDPAALRAARAAAARLGAEFDWEQLFGEAFRASAAYLR